ncbi:MAG: cyclic nucleotide-binding domain-containing protein [Planctomycetota bacterium]
MNDAMVERLLQREPFSSIDPKAFPKSIPLSGVLRNDCRVLDLQEGDIIVREGDYGNSAFLILDGTALVSLKKLPANLLGRNTRQKSGWLATLWKGLSQSNHAEVRDYNQKPADPDGTGTREDATGTRVFLHDIPRVLAPNQSIELCAGEVFGEISALTRSPRSATVVAKTKMQLLEIRWQGFRELLNRHHALRDHVERLYRENSLRTHLRESEVFAGVDHDVMERIAAATVFESFGDFRWNREFKSTQKKDIAERILSEELIAEEGQPANDLIMIRSGFARLSRCYGDGHQTIAYLGKGQAFGLREIAHNWNHHQQRPWTLSLRAIGYVDVLRIPAAIVSELILPTLPEDKQPPPLPAQTLEPNTQERRMVERAESPDTGLLEFLVEQRFINGTQAMVIDLDRCTRCDDCVRACASTHDNNSRFNRTGPIHDHYLFANACMHCLDPVCMIGCPTGAIGRDPETGNVTINDQTCIGCSTCANSCPYQNIRMVEINNPHGLPIIDSQTGAQIQKATKCDLCNDHDGGPACQQACPHDALFRIDLSNSEGI